MDCLLVKSIKDDYLTLPTSYLWSKFKTISSHSIVQKTYGKYPNSVYYLFYISGVTLEVNKSTVATNTSQCNTAYASIPFCDSAKVYSCWIQKVFSSFCWNLLLKDLPVTHKLYAQSTWYYDRFEPIKLASTGGEE